MRRNLDFFRGTTFSFSGQVRDSAGNGVDLTSAVLTWRAAPQRRRLSEITLTSTASQITKDALGNWTVTIPATSTEELWSGWYRHQGEYVLNGETKLFVEGEMNLREDINSS